MTGSQRDADLTGHAKECDLIPEAAGMLRDELCLPPRYAEALPPSTSECDLTGNRAVVDIISSDEVILE